MKTEDTKPKENAAGEIITEVQAEVIKKEANASDSMSFGARALVLAVANDICKRSPNSQTKILMEEMLTYNTAWAMLEMSYDKLEDGQKAKINLPKNDKNIVESFINTFSDLGVTLHPLAQSNDQQMSFEFSKEDVKKDTLENIETKKNVIQQPVIPELNPEKWENEDMVRKGLFYQLATAKGRMGDNLVSAIEMLKIYLRSQAKTDEEKSKVNTIDMGYLLKDLTNRLGTKKVFIVKGLATCCANSLNHYKNPIFAHGTIMKNIPNLNPDQVRDVVKSFVEIALEANPKKYEDGHDILKDGYYSATREDYLDMVKEETDRSKACIRIMKNSMLERPNPTHPDYELLMVNSLIEVANMYRDDATKLKLYTKGEFPVSSKEQVAPSTPETKKEEEKPVPPKEEEKKAEESKADESKGEQQKQESKPQENSGKNKKDKKKKK